ncbi:hypothetical protein ACV35H_32770, partial [Pseudomonas aeruginosa]
ALGVQDYFIGEPKGFYKVDPSRAPLPRYLSALGMTGMTAYFALLDVGQPKNGETVVSSGAAGDAYHPAALEPGDLPGNAAHRTGGA